jgi:hypothetical protein
LALSTLASFLLRPMAASACREAEHPFDLGPGVEHGVVGFVAGLARLLARTKVDAAGQFAHHQHIDALQDLFFNGAGADQLWVELDRAQIREEIERLANAQQSSLRAILRVGIVPLGAAYGAEQNRVGCPGRLHRFIGQAGSFGVDGAAAHQLLVEGKGVAEFTCHGCQDLLRFVCNFRADAVTGQDNDGRFQGLRSFWCESVNDQGFSADCENVRLGD